MNTAKTKFSQFKELEKGSKEEKAFINTNDIFSVINTISAGNTNDIVDVYKRYLDYSKTLVKKEKSVFDIWLNKNGENLISSSQFLSAKYNIRVFLQTYTPEEIKKELNVDINTIISAMTISSKKIKTADCPRKNKLHDDFVSKDEHVKIFQAEWDEYQKRKSNFKKALEGTKEEKIVEEGKEITVDKNYHVLSIEDCKREFTILTKEIKNVEPIKIYQWIDNIDFLPASEIVQQIRNNLLIFAKEENLYNDAEYFEHSREILNAIFDRLGLFIPKFITKASRNAFKNSVIIQNLLCRLGADIFINSSAIKKFNENYPSFKLMSSYEEKRDFIRREYGTKKCVEVLLNSGIDFSKFLNLFGYTITKEGQLKDNSYANKGYIREAIKKMYDKEDSKLTGKYGFDVEGVEEVTEKVEEVYHPKMEEHDYEPFIYDPKSEPEEKKEEVLLTTENFVEGVTISFNLEGKYEDIKDILMFQLKKLEEMKIASGTTVSFNISAVIGC